MSGSPARPDAGRAQGPQAEAAAVRRSAGLFHLESGLVRVAGGDCVRWLDGMLTADVAGLRPGGEASGRYALALTRQGRIVADLHLLLRPEGFWLDTAAAAVAPLLAHLEKFIIADAVELADESAATARLGIEGPGARAVVEAACGGPLRLAPDACCGARVRETDVVVAAFGWTGEPAYQLFVPVAARDGVAAALREAAPAGRLVDGSAAGLAILRIEAGVPAYGSELGDDVLPAEAALERAVSTTKGCYTGQEVVARMAIRGRVSHRLVGLRFPDEDPAAAGSSVEASGRRVGEVTSACISPAAGAIALAFVRRAHAEPGTEVAAGGRTAQVAALPFLSLGSG